MIIRFQSPPSRSPTVPENEPPSGSPTVLLWRKCPFSRAFFYISLEFFIIVFLITSNFTLLSKVLRKESTPDVPQNGVSMGTVAISRALLSISFVVFSKETLSTGSPQRAPTEIRSISISLLHPSFKVSDE